MKILFFVFALSLAVAHGAKVDVPSGISHEAFDQLLKRYVNERGLVDYERWKHSRADRAALDQYLAQFAPQPKQTASGDEQAASLINLYNALTIDYILKNYPTESIQSLSDPFSATRHIAGGERVSLNDIEHDTLRPMIGWKAHGVLVCAARSCPPLQRAAYNAEKLDEQVAQAYREWLARDDLNRYIPHENKIEVSSIFKWFREDFEKTGGLRPILARRGPDEYQKFLAGKNYRIDHLPYDWGLNDQSGVGKSYSRARMIFDRVFDFIKFWD
jgi:hypothetical protein